MTMFEVLYVNVTDLPYLPSVDFSIAFYLAGVANVFALSCQNEVVIFSV